MSTIFAVSLNPLHTFSKLPQPAIHLLAGQGVQGDAHCGTTVQHLYLKRRNAAAPNLMQVHLLQCELFAELGADHPLTAGELGENITTQGVDLLRLPAGTRLHLGPGAIVELTGLRTPCKQIDRFQTGLQTQLLDRTLPPCRRGKAGVMAVVLRSGTCKPSDAIHIDFPNGTFRPLLHI